MDTAPPPPPSSPPSPPPPDATARSPQPPHSPRPSSVTTTSPVECYDYLVFGVAAALVLGDLYFPAGRPSAMAVSAYIVGLAVVALVLIKVLAGWSRVR